MRSSGVSGSDLVPSLVLHFYQILLRISLTKVLRHPQIAELSDVHCLWVPYNQLSYGMFWVVIISLECRWLFFAYSGKWLWLLDVVMHYFLFVYFIKHCLTYPENFWQTLDDIFWFSIPFHMWDTYWELGSVLISTLMKTSLSFVPCITAHVCNLSWFCVTPICSNTQN